jgi:hypothetical protein
MEATYGLNRTKINTKHVIIRSRESWEVPQGNGETSMNISTSRNCLVAPKAINKRRCKRGNADGVVKGM